MDRKCSRSCLLTQRPVWPCSKNHKTVGYDRQCLQHTQHTCTCGWQCTCRQRTLYSYLFFWQPVDKFLKLIWSFEYHVNTIAKTYAVKSVGNPVVYEITASFFFFCEGSPLESSLARPLTTFINLSVTATSTLEGKPASCRRATCFAKLAPNKCLQDFSSADLKHEEAMPLFTTLEWADLKLRIGVAERGS